MTSSTLRPEYISLQVAATLYAVSVDLLRHRIATGELPAVHADRAPCGGGLSRWSSVSRRPAREGGHDSIIPVGVQLRHGCFG